jgi:hypothetical protein
MNYGTKWNLLMENQTKTCCDTILLNTGSSSGKEPSCRREPVGKKKMATLGNALMGALLGHSDAEKMFR